MSRTATTIAVTVLAALLLPTGLAQAAATAADPMPQPDLCTRSIPLGNVEVVQKRPRPAEGCAPYETSAFSPEAQLKYTQWWNKQVATKSSADPV